MDDTNSIESNCIKKGEEISVLELKMPQSQDKYESKNALNPEK
jgi:hypothetical protein